MPNPNNPLGWDAPFETTDLQPPTQAKLAKMLMKVARRRMQRRMVTRMPKRKKVKFQ
jgi:hypothetical protein